MPLYFCYLLVSEDGARTYNGYTTNLTRRLRQHNGELQGGARATKTHRPYRFVAVVHHPDWSASEAMKFEWHMRYPTRKKPRPREYSGVGGRLQSFEHLFKQENAPIISSLNTLLEIGPTCEATQYQLYVADEYLHYLPRFA